jgi:protein-tyrosine phosphatase
LGYVSQYPDIILEKLAILKEELIRRQIRVEIEAAAEYYCDEHFEKEIEAQTLLTFGKKKYVLFEISFAQENVESRQGHFQYAIGGLYTPILAHPERYEFWHNDFRKYESMLDKDVSSTS